MAREDYRLIYLTRGYEAKVSACDYEWVARYKWRYHNYGYACRTVTYADKRKCVYLHRFLMHPGAGLVVNHIDGDGLNCTRKNLEVVRGRTNVSTKRVRKGTIPYTGLFYGRPELGERSDIKNVRAVIRIKGKRKSLGYYYTHEEAARAYDRASVDAFGVLADTNFPLSDYLCPVNLEPVAQPTLDAFIPF